MSAVAQQLMYWVVNSETKPWYARVQKLVANEIMLEFRQRGTDKLLHSVTLDYEEAYALRGALWWVEHIDPSPSTL